SFHFVLSITIDDDVVVEEYALVDDTVVVNTEAISVFFLIDLPLCILSGVLLVKPSFCKMNDIKKKYANITEKQVTLFISGCHECKLKRTKPKNSSKLVLRPIISNDFNARGQVDLIDMQSCPDSHFKFILNYQDHFTKFCILRPLKTRTAAEVAFHLLDIFTTFGAPIILQSDNGREFVAKIIEELSNMWKGFKSSFRLMITAFRTMKNDYVCYRLISHS
ncbi:unnamed protein product, partial [Rotaria sp. Silwood2]